MKKFKNWIVLILVFVSLLVVAFVFFFQGKDVEEKVLYGKSDHGKYYLVDTYESGVHEKNYRCKSSLCQVYVENKERAIFDLFSYRENDNPYFLIEDDGYVLFHILSGESKRLSFSKEDILNIRIMNRYLYVSYKDSNLESKVYNFDNEVLLSFLPRDYQVKLGEENIFLYNNNEWKVFSVLEKQFIKTYTEDMLFEGYQVNGKEYYYSSSFHQLVDNKMNLIFDNYYLKGVADEKFLVLDSNQKFVCNGGIQCSGYIPIYHFLLLDETGKTVYRSKEYKTIQSFVSNKNQVEYFFAVDDANYLNLYDMKENTILTLDEVWDDEKVLCVIKLENDILEFSIDTVEYHYNIKTKEIQSFAIQEPICTQNS